MKAWCSDHTPTRWWGSLVFCIHSSRLSLFCNNHLQGRHYFCGRQTVENHLVHTSTNLYRHHLMTSSIPSWFIFSWFIFLRMQVCPQNHKNLHPVKFPAIRYYLQLPVMLMVVNLPSSAVGLWPWFCKSIGPHHDAKVDGWNLQVGSTGGDMACSRHSLVNDCPCTLHRTNNVWHCTEYWAKSWDGCFFMWSLRTICSGTG